MIRKYHTHTLQTNPWHIEEEPQNIYSNNTSLEIEVVTPDITRTKLCPVDGPMYSKVICDKFRHHVIHFTSAVILF